MSTRLMLFQLGGGATGIAVALAALLAFRINSGIAVLVVGGVCLFAGQIAAIRLGLHLDGARRPTMATDASLWERLYAHNDDSLNRARAAVDESKSRRLRGGG